MFYFHILSIMWVLSLNKKKKTTLSYHLYALKFVYFKCSVECFLVNLQSHTAIRDVGSCPQFER